MAKIGLNPNKELEKALSYAQEHFDNMQKHPVAIRKYHHFLQASTKIIATARENKDIPMLFKLEKTAQEFDLGRTSNLDKRAGSLSALRTMENDWKQMQDPAYVKAHFEKAHAKLIDPLKKVKDTSIDTSIRSQCQKLGSITGDLAAPIEKAFYNERQQNLKFIGKEHSLNINQIMGLTPNDKDKVEKSKEKNIEKDAIKTLSPQELKKEFPHLEGIANFIERAEQGKIGDDRMKETFRDVVANQFEQNPKSFEQFEDRNIKVDVNLEQTTHKDRDTDIEH